MMHDNLKLVLYIYRNFYRETHTKRNKYEIIDIYQNVIVL